MPRGNFASADREAVIADFRDTELTIKQIAAKHGVGYATVSTWAHAAGLSRTRGPRPSAPIADRDAVLADWQDPDLTITEICRKHHTSYDVVTRWAREAGLEHLRSNRRSESPAVLHESAGAWVYDKNGVAHWTPRASAQPQPEGQAS